MAVARPMSSGMIISGLLLFKQCGRFREGDRGSDKGGGGYSGCQDEYAGSGQHGGCAHGQGRRDSSKDEQAWNLDEDVVLCQNSIDPLPSMSSMPAGITLPRAGSNQAPFVVRALRALYRGRL
jgi:hypothetical protein